MLLRRRRWSVIKPLATRLNGDERSRRVGAGVEFAGVRDYQPGDDVRRIDWNLTARANSPFVREAQVEAALDVWLVADVSGSVDWGTGFVMCGTRGRSPGGVRGRLGGRASDWVG